MVLRKTFIILLAATSALSLSSCSDNKRYETAICALADTSGTYVKQKQKMVKIIKAGILPTLLPGDSLFLIAIDSSSYDEKNIKGQLKLDYRPSQANQQRIEFAQVLEKFEKEQTSARYTDISGAMMLCKGRLETTMAGTQIILVFSDMKEELKPGIKRSFDENEFENINVAAMNVIKLSEDNTNPQVFRSRMKKWEKRILAHGAASWNANLEPVEIANYIDDLR